MSNFNLIYLKDVADSQTGPFGSQLHQSDYVSEGTPMVTVEHLGVERFTHQNLPFVSDKDRDRLSKYILREGDIVFSRVGSVDRCTYVTKEEDGWMFSGRCIRVRTNENANGRYLNFYFRQDTFKKMMLDISVGATMPSLNTKLMDNIPLRLPNIQTQQKIAKVLSDLDAKIEINNRINTELEAMTKTLYDYWFVQFDFPDADGNPYKTSGGKMVWNAELKREIPEGWEVKTIEDYAEVKKGDLITARDSKEGQVKVVAAGINYSYLNSVSNRKKNTITISGSGANAGFINFWREPIFASDCITVRGKNDTITLMILQHLRLLQEYILSQATGSAQPHVYPSDIKILNYVIPPNNLIELFGKNVIPMNDKVANNLKENQKLSSLRDWLLPMLMNGQVSVGDFEEELRMVAEGCGG